LVRAWLGDIVDGTLKPRRGVGLIFGQGWLKLQHPKELDQLVALMDYWDDMTQDRDVICGEIIAAAREALVVW